MRYSVILQHAQEGGYRAEAPVLPGCYSQSDTSDETLENV